MKHLFTTITILCGLLLMNSQTFAQQSVPESCPNVDAALYNANWFPRYDYNASQLQIVDWITGETVQILEDDLTIDEFYPYAWSPDCRYIVGHLGFFKDATLAVWDVIEGRRINSIENLYLYEVRFSPRSDQLLVEARTGAFLWRFNSGEKAQLTDDFRCYGRSFTRNIKWDYGRNIFIGTEQDYTCRHFPGPIHVHDLTGGERLATFNGSGYEIQNGNRLIAYGSPFPFGTYRFVSIYNLDTLSLLERVAVPQDDWRFRDYVRFAITPDDRYVIGDKYGIFAVNLQTDSLAIMTGSDFSNDWENIIVTNNTLEASLADGNIYRWNVETGEQLK